MRLTAFQVRHFRNVVDSQVVLVDELVTCLVGKNESGKSTLLEALRRINPTDRAGLDAQRDFPRWLLTAAKKAGTVDSIEPITCWYQLDEPEIAAVESRLGPGVISPASRIRMWKRYDGQGHYEVEGLDSKAAVANLLERKAVSPSSRALLAPADDLDDLTAACDAALAKARDPATEAELEQLKTAAGPDRVAAVVWETVAEGEPRFFYFSDYSMLRGRLDLDDLAREAEAQDPGASARQTALALLSLAATTPQELAGDDYEASSAEMEAVSNQLTEEVFTYWRQNDSLRVRIAVDRTIKKTKRTVSVQNPYNQPQAVEVDDLTTKNYLEIRVEDTRHHFTNNFSERSSGFRWFFSFLAAFSEFETGSTGPVVVLLDEPGLTLHAKAQADFLAFINTRLAPKVQVIYTTHSPFMVETGSLQRVRIIEDKGPKQGAVASSEILSVSADSRFALAAALGYDFSQHLFIGEHNLLVEGPSDLLYLDILNRALGDQREQLDPRWRLLPAGGSSNIPAFLSLLGRELTVTVLIDSGTEGSQRIRQALSATGHTDKRLVEVGETLGARHADIEDLFAVDDYLALYNAAYATHHTPSELPPGDRIVKRLEQLDGKFDHYLPANYLLRHPDLVNAFSVETVDNFAKLISRINASENP